MQRASLNKKQTFDQADGIIRARLTGSDTASAEGISVTSSSPVLALCRELIKLPYDPNIRLVAYRGDTLALIVRSIGEAARLEVSGHGTGFIVRCDRYTGPPTVPDIPARTRHRARRAA